MKAAILAGVLSMSFGQPPANAEDQKLAAAFQRFLDDEFAHRPLEATRAGDHRFDHLLDDLSPKAQAAGRLRIRVALQDLTKSVDAKRLSRDGQIDLEIWQQYLQRELWLAENTKPLEDDPRIYNDYITDSVYQLLTQSTLPKETNLKNARSRIEQIPRIIEAAKATLKNPPKVVVETAIRQNKGNIVFYESGIYELSGETPQLSELRPAIQKILPALHAHQKFLQEELLPRATGDWRIGKKRFAEKLEFELNAGISAEEVLKEAESEADRVEAEMYVIARQLWSTLFPNQSVPADDTPGKRKMIRMVLDHLSNDHGRPENLIADAKAAAASVQVFIREKGILKLPEPDNCKIIEMPEFQRGNSVAYLNPAPPLDAKASSYYAISPPPRDWDEKRVKSFMREYNRHMIQILTIHEAYPGHYVQLEYSNRNPSLIRKVLWSGVFAEGWAVYTEQMLLDEGYGKGDLGMRIMQLKWYLRAVVNAILDFKMHSAGLTDEEALFLLVERAYQSEAEAILKIIRAKQTSCQLSTYFVGRMAFQRLRRRYQNELGEDFNLGRFHEAVLSHGTLAVRYLPELVGRDLRRK